MSAGGIRRRLEGAVQHQHTPGCIRMPAFAIWRQISTEYIPGNRGQYARKTAICNSLSGRRSGESQRG